MRERLSQMREKEGEREEVTEGRREGGREGGGEGEGVRGRDFHFHSHHPLLQARLTQCVDHLEATRPEGSSPEPLDRFLYTHYHISIIK